MAAHDETTGRGGGARSAGSVSGGGTGGTSGGVSVGRGDRHRSTETKASVKTSELAAYIIVFIGILIASVVVNGGDNSSDPDLFTADKAWLYITILTLGYMVSRGLAKSGSREPYTDDDH